MKKLIAILLLMFAAPALAEKNGDVKFDSSAYWTTGSGNVSGGKANATALTGKLVEKSGAGISEHSVYTYRFTVTRSAGCVQPYLRAIPSGSLPVNELARNGLGKTRCASGIYSGEFLAPMGGADVFGLYGTGFTGTVDGFSLVETSTGHMGPATVSSMNLMPKVDVSAIVAPKVGIGTQSIGPSNQGRHNTGSLFNGSFRHTCRFSHFNFDDAIALPGFPGKSHLHVYFGNTGANASSTALSIRTTGNSTCFGGTANRSAYWAPAWVDKVTGAPLVPTSFVPYYKSAKLLASSLVDLPVGLRMIAGNPRATGPGDTSPHSVYSCYQGPGEQNPIGNHPAFGLCPSNTTHINAQLFFPQCWDGVNLDSADHISHMSYSYNTSTGLCEGTHPVGIVEIMFNIHYDLPSGKTPQDYRLSSDMYPTSLPAGYSNHGDWFNGWDTTISGTWHDLCTVVSLDCGTNHIGNDTELLDPGAN